jgi:AcrR family transcriptional regulator
VHYYFGNKKDLLLAVMDRSLEPLAAALAAMKEETSASPQQMISLVVNMAGKHPALPRLVVREILLATGDTQEIFIRHYAPRLGGALPGLLKKGQDQGRIRNDIDPNISALMLMSLSLFPFIARNVAESVLGIEFDEAGLKKLEHQVGELLTGGLTL